MINELIDLIKRTEREDFDPDFLSVGPDRVDYCPSGSPGVFSLRVMPSNASIVGVNIRYDHAVEDIIGGKCWGVIIFTDKDIDEDHPARRFALLKDRNLVNFVFDGEDKINDMTLYYGSCSGFSPGSPMRLFVKGKA